MFNAAISWAGILMPFLSSVVSSTASTVSPVVVVVPRMSLSMIGRLRSGCPAQLRLIWLKKRCSMGFHLEAPLG
jgi:hypothetical protein